MDSYARDSGSKLEPQWHKSFNGKACSVLDIIKQTLDKSILTQRDFSFPMEFNMVVGKYLCPFQFNIEDCLRKPALTKVRPDDDGKIVPTLCWENGEDSADRRRHSGSYKGRRVEFGINGIDKGRGVAFPTIIQWPQSEVLIDSWARARCKFTWHREDSKALSIDLKKAYPTRCKDHDMSRAERPEVSKHGSSLVRCNVMGQSQVAVCQGLGCQIFQDFRKLIK